MQTLEEMLKNMTVAELDRLIENYEQRIKDLQDHIARVKENKASI